MQKLKLKVGEKVVVLPGHFGPFPITGRIIEIDSDPFEYDQVKVEMQDSPALGQKPKRWVSERSVKRA